MKEFLIDQNATRAAIAAGFSKKTAHVQGHRLLKNVKVRALIDSGNMAVNGKLEVTLERVREELARLAFYDPRDFWNEDGTAKAVTELDENTARALAGFETAELFTGSGEKRETAGYVKKFKLADKGLNLERLGRYLKMFTDKVELTAGDELLRRLAAGRQRARG